MSQVVVGANCEVVRFNGAKLSRIVKLKLSVGDNFAGPRGIICQDTIGESDDLRPSAASRSLASSKASSRRYVDRGNFERAGKCRDTS